MWRGPFSSVRALDSSKMASIGAFTSRPKSMPVSSREMALLPLQHTHEFGLFVLLGIFVKFLAVEKSVVFEDTTLSEKFAADSGELHLVPDASSTDQSIHLVVW